MCDSYKPVNDRIATIRIQYKPINCSKSIRPTSSSEEQYIEAFYETVQSVIDQTPSGDSLYIIRDWNAKVGKYI